MISISTQSSSSYSLVLKENADGTEIEQYTRRNARSATLDGSSVISDFGYTDTDRTLIIDADITVAQKEILKQMIQNYSTIIVSTKDGCFVCAPKNFRMTNGQIRIIIWIKE